MEECLFYRKQNDSKLCTGEGLTAGVCSGGPESGAAVNEGCDRGDRVFGYAAD